MAKELGARFVLTGVFRHYMDLRKRVKGAQGVRFFFLTVTVRGGALGDLSTPKN
jgi:hypothetical protein